MKHYRNVTTCRDSGMAKQDRDHSINKFSMQHPEQLSVKCLNAASCENCCVPA